MLDNNEWNLVVSRLIVPERTVSATGRGAEIREIYLIILQKAPSFDFGLSRDSCIRPHLFSIELGPIRLAKPAISRETHPGHSEHPYRYRELRGQGQEMNPDIAG